MITLVAELGGLMGTTMRFAVTLLIAASIPAVGWVRKEAGLPLQAMSLDEIVQARAAGTGCTWLGGRGFTRRVAMKEDRGAVKRNGKIVALRPATGAEEVFPYTYHRWTGGGMDIVIHDVGRELGRGPEHVEKVATLTLTENGRGRSWRGRLNCGS